LTHEEVEHAASRLQRRFLRKTQVFLRVSKETISRITDKVIEEMNDWAVRPLDEIYAAIFIDAIVVKVHDGQVGNRPFYASRVATLRQVLDDAVEQRWIAALWPLARGDRDASCRPGPNDPARFGKLDCGVPLAQWLSQCRMEVKRSPLASHVCGCMAAQHVQRCNRYEHHVGEPETNGCQSLSHITQFVLKPRPGCRPDSRQTP
jgi:hypothetical protein